MQIFISVHDQDLILQLEKNKCFRNIKNYKYLFLGKRTVDKLGKLKKKVIIARDLKNNIEDEKALYDYTGWYALIKNDLIKGKYVVIVQYDCFLKENFEKVIKQTLKDFPDRFIGFQPNQEYCNFLFPEEFSIALREAAKEVYNLDVKKIAADAYNSGDTTWSGGGTFACSKKWLEDYINWIEPMKSIMLKDKMVAHSIERAIKIFNIINNIKEVYLPDILEHIFNCSHDQIYQPEEMRESQQNRFSDFINGKLFDDKEKVKLNFLEKIFSVKNAGTHKLLTFLGIKMYFRNAKLQIRRLEAEKAQLLSEVYKRDKIIQEKDNEIKRLKEEN